MTAPAIIPARYGDGLAVRGDSLPGAALPWLRDLRAQSWDRFAATGLPSQKLEAWRYTSVRPIRDTAFAPAEALANGLAREQVPALLQDAAARLVFVNGFWRADLSDLDSLPGGVTLMSLADALAADSSLVAPLLRQALAAEDAPLAALNGALMEDGYVLHLAPNARLDRPVELTFVHLGDAPVEYHSRHLLFAGANSAGTVLEHHVDLGSGACFANHALTIVAETGAQLRRCKLQAEGGEAVHMATTRIDVGRDADVANIEVTTGPALAPVPQHETHYAAAT